MSAKPPPSSPSHPSWPSLYNPRSELFDIQHHGPEQPGGIYLTDAGGRSRVTSLVLLIFPCTADVFRFTLYWTLVFYLPIFAVFGLYAFLNLTFPPSRQNTRTRNWKAEAGSAEEEEQTDILLQPLSLPSQHSHNLNTLASSAIISNRYQSLRSTIGTLKGRTQSSLPPSPLTPHSPPILRPTKKQNPRRSRVTFALLVLFAFLTLSLLGAVLSSAIIGFIITGLYRAGKFRISTWVPFLWALIHVLIGMLKYVALCMCRARKLILLK